MCATRLAKKKINHDYVDAVAEGSENVQCYKTAAVFPETQSLRYDRLRRTGRPAFLCVRAYAKNVQACNLLVHFPLSKCIG